METKKYGKMTIKELDLDMKSVLEAMCKFETVMILISDDNRGTFFTIDLKTRSLNSIQEYLNGNVYGPVLAVFAVEETKPNN